MKRTTVIGAAAAVSIVIVVVAVAAFILYNPPDIGQPSPTEQQSSQTNSSSSVAIENFAFAPSSITVSEGTTITWTNNDNVDHTVTSTSGPESFDSGNMGQGETFRHTFTQAGTYDYICSIHPFMRAQVIVTPAST